MQKSDLRDVGIENINPNENIQKEKQLKPVNKDKSEKNNNDKNLNNKTDKSVKKNEIQEPPPKLEIVESLSSSTSVEQSPVFHPKNNQLNNKDQKNKKNKRNELSSIPHVCKLIYFFILFFLSKRS